MMGSGSDFGFGAFAKAFVFLLALLPLGVWKLIEIVVWLVTHVRVSW